MKVALKYCGSCNPRMDLSRIGRSVAGVVALCPDFSLVPLSSGDIDVVVILCGCPRACANKDEVRRRAKRYLLINDESLGEAPLLEANLRAVTNC